MLMKKICFFVLTVLIISAVWTGCSRDEFRGNLNSIGKADGVALYFPLAEGYTTVYSVQYANGEQATVRYEAGREVSLGSGEAVEWRTYADGGNTGTSYFTASSDAVDHYSGNGSTPHRILEAPLSYGHTWMVEVDVSDGGINYDSLSTNTNDKDSTDTIQIDNDGPLLSYPALGSVYLSVAGFEALTLSNGTYYSSALKITSTNQYGDESYYWYVAGVGLVKYVLDATGTDYPEGREVGELVQYGFN